VGACRVASGSDLRGGLTGRLGEGLRGEGYWLRGKAGGGRRVDLRGKVRGDLNNQIERVSGALAPFLMAGPSMSSGAAERYPIDI